MQGGSAKPLDGRDPSQRRLREAPTYAPTASIRANLKHEKSWSPEGPWPGPALKPNIDPADNTSMGNDDVRAWRRIEKEGAELASVAFLPTHPSCGDSVKIQRGPWSLVCWCEGCKDLRTFELMRGES